ncbi:MAG: hypothetical protein ACI8RZ_003275 [Myxococcota bacterium]|jgi:hypothetical protein
MLTSRYTAPVLMQLIISTLPPAHAEGFLATDAVMFADTVLYVDIYNADDEAIAWIGSGSVDIYDEAGKEVGELGEYETLRPTSGNGTYKVVLQEDQEQWWQVSVYELSIEHTGRLHSYDWHFDTTGTDSGQWADFYVAVPMGDSSTVSVVKAELSGLIGDDLHIRANEAGIPGHSTRSVPMKTATPSGELAIYLADPELGAFTEALTVGTPEYTPDGGLCENLLSPEVVGGTFSMPLDLGGVWQVTCDTSGDGEFDLSGYTDVIAHHSASAKGTASVRWDGLDADGQPVSDGPLTCQVDFFQGPVHMLVGDADTAYEGVRLFTQEASGSYVESVMFWNDVAVQSQGNGLPYTTDNAKISSGPDGLSTQRPIIPADPNENTHAWGDYSATSKGTDVWIDTWLASDTLTAGEITLEIIDQDADADSDLLLDTEERCLTGTDHKDADSDNDGLTDGDEVDDVENPRDFDGDGDIDALDDDDDGDGILTATEISDGAQHGHDTDGDGADHWYDKDSDDDGIPDEDEPGDANGDGVPDYLQAEGTPDTGTPDTGTPDTGTPDTGDPSPGLLGRFQGGACTCGGGGVAAGWLLVPLLLLVRRRRYC